VIKMTRLNNTEILEKLRSKFGADILFSEEPYGLLTISISKQIINDILAYLYSETDLGFQFLTDLCGIHYPENINAELGVVYHLQNMRTNTRLRLKAFTPVSNPRFPTVTTLFNSANWMERETYDFYGIIFEGHPNLKRILNMDEMSDFPMRKEFPLEDQTRLDKDDKMFGR
jgi:NADH-quinone oxidoreductase subunit C